MPGLYNHKADNWRPLFAIVEVVGGPWPQRVEHVVTFHAKMGNDRATYGVILLTDIRRILSQIKQLTLSSNYLADYFAGMQNRF